jgi:hypothetical protein
MKWLAVVFGLILAFGCGNKQHAKEEDEEAAFNYETFSEHYTKASLPYQLSDTALQKNKDTARIAAAQLIPFISDSIRKKLFGKSTSIRYIPLHRIEDKKGESYFITKATGGGKTVALLTVFSKNHDSAATFPFLSPDSNTTTTQVSVIDNSFSISRNVTQREKNGVIIEGKDVYAYNEAVNGFTLIMTDVLDERTQELINPIDTFPRRHHFSGDYVKDKRNIVSIRDGRNDKELLVFVHMEKEEGTCTGELKGTLFFTSSKTAVYRQGGDPCVMEFTFATNAVTVHEDEGCGAHRDMKCVFDDTYKRKDAAKQKATKKKPARK